MSWRSSIASVAEVLGARVVAGLVEADRVRVGGVVEAELRRGAGSSRATNASSEPAAACASVSAASLPRDQQQAVEQVADLDPLPRLEPEQRLGRERVVRRRDRPRRRGRARGGRRRRSSASSSTRSSRSARRRGRRAPRRRRRRPGPRPAPAAAAAARAAAAAAVAGRERGETERARSGDRRGGAQPRRAPCIRRRPGRRSSGPGA